jgi:hypothetical protein
MFGGGREGYVISHCWSLLPALQFVGEDNYVSGNRRQPRSQWNCKQPGRHAVSEGNANVEWLSRGGMKPRFVLMLFMHFN